MVQEQLVLKGRAGQIGTRGELAPRVFLLTWLLPTYGDDVFMLHIYQPEYQEFMEAKPVLV